jgi:hypothetical protein
VNALTEHIRSRLKLKKFCMVFEKELNRVWPREKLLPEARKRQIMAFAKKNNWEAIIYDPGLRVSFRQLKT